MSKTNTERRQLRRAELKARQGGSCHWCGVQMLDDVPEAHPQRCTLDHVRPQAMGGTDRWDNLVAACRACNERRSQVQTNPRKRRRVVTASNRVSA